MPNIAFKREEIRKLEKSYETIRDCLAGEVQVKARGTRYLPQPNAEDKSEENRKRYDAYLTRAVFYNVAERTLEGLVGQIFLRDPLVEVPDVLDAFVKDATGSGVSLDQQAQQATCYVLPHGRAGLYVDYPDTGEEGASVADVASGKVRPFMTLVAPWDWINWRVKQRGAEKVISLTVIREDYTDEDDGFETKKKSQWRVLRLVDVNGKDVLQCQIFREKNGLKPYKEYYPKDASGNFFDHVTFHPIGAETNDPDKVSNPPFYALCSVNMGHYRNSADYEESVYFIGQPTPVFAGLTEEWVNKVMGGAVTLGARGGVMLPVGGTAEILQVEPNTLAKEAMEHKEGQMLALGAKLAEGSQVERTATEADHDNTSENSVLAKVARNVGSAIESALRDACLFVGADPEKIKFKLNTEFDLVKMLPAERAQLLKEWQSGAIAFSEMRENLRRSGVAKLDDKEAQKEIAAEQAEALARAVEEASAMADAVPQPEPATGV